MKEYIPTFSRKYLSQEYKRINRHQSGVKKQASGVRVRPCR